MGAIFTHAWCYSNAVWVLYLHMYGCLSTPQGELEYTLKGVNKTPHFLSVFFSIECQTFATCFSSLGSPPGHSVPVRPPIAADTVATVCLGPFDWHSRRTQQWVKVSNYIFYHKSITFIKSALLASEVCGNVCCCVQLVVN